MVTCLFRQGVQEFSVGRDSYAIVLIGVVATTELNLAGQISRRCVLTRYGTEFPFPDNRCSLITALGRASAVRLFSASVPRKLWRAGFREDLEIGYGVCVGPLPLLYYYHKNSIIASDCRFHLTSLIGLRASPLEAPCRG